MERGTAPARRGFEPRRSRAAALRRGLAACVCVLVLGAVPALAQEYSIPAIDVSVEIGRDGRVHVSEARTYVYDGRFTWANYRLPKRGFSAIADIGVAEGANRFVNDNDEAPGTFLVEDSSQAVNVRWFYAAEDERRTFTVSYALDGALVVGPQWSEFFWTYAAAGRERRTERLDIAIRLPAAVAADDLHAWTRGPQDRIDVASVPGGYDATATRIGAREPVTIRTVFPTSVLDASAAAVTDPDFSLEWARADEEAFRASRIRRAERDARVGGIGRQVALAAALLGVAAFVIVFGKYGKRFPADGAIGTHVGLVVPGRLEPAAIGWLLAGRQTTTGHVLATLLDLARRGYFRIEERPPKPGWLSRDRSTFTIEATGQAPRDDLLDWERSLLEFVRARLDGGGRDLEKLFSQDASPARKWFSAWKRDVAAEASGRGWVDKTSYRGASLNAGIQLALLIAALVAVPFAGPGALFAVLLCGVLALLSLAIIRNTREGETVYRRWKIYRDTLARGDSRAGDGALDLHFIYAVAFGVRKQGIESLFEDSQDAAAAMTWIVLVDPHRSPASLARTFTTLNATGATAVGGVAGTGGGASAGAAGGGASGGAG